jgi:hypothetical protein
VKGRRLRRPDGTERLGASALDLLRFLDTNADGDIRPDDPAATALLFFTDTDGDGASDAQVEWVAVWGLVLSIDRTSGVFRMHDGTSRAAVEPGCTP